jgi:hypothetical protein
LLGQDNVAVVFRRVGDVGHLLDFGQGVAMQLLACHSVVVSKGKGAGRRIRDGPLSAGRSRGDQLDCGLDGICAMFWNVLQLTPEAAQELVPGVQAAADGAVRTIVYASGKKLFGGAETADPG